MADRTQLKAAASNHIADDDPFAELTRIMGFDPRQPVKPQTPVAAKAAPTNQAAEESDFDIDLEKELMGEFDAAEESATVTQQAARHEPAYEAGNAALTDDELAASFEQDFVFDDAADHAHFATPRASEPAADIALDDDFDPFDDDFDKAVAGSLEVSPQEDEVSPLEDDLSIDQEMAASLDDGFQIDHHEPDAGHGAVAAAEPAAVEPAAEAAFDADFDNAVQMSLEDELAFDDREVEQHPEAADVQSVAAPAAAEQSIADENFDSQVDQAEFDQAQFDQAMSEGDMGLDQPQDLILEQELSVDDERPQAVEDEQPTAVENEQPQAVENSRLEAVEAPAEVAHFAADPEPAIDPEPVADHEAAADQVVEDDFELSFRDALAEEAEAPADPEPVADHEAAADQVIEDDFELNFGDALAEEPEVPAVEPVAAAEPSFAQSAPAVSAPVPPVAAVEPAKPAATSSERSLEDELNALLGAMTARPIPAAPAPAAPIPAAPIPVKEPAAASQPAGHTGHQAAADDLDWDIDEHEPARAEQTARPADADLDSLLADELDRQGFEEAAPEQNAEPSIDFDDEAFDSAFAKGIEMDAPVAPAEPSRSWSRVTPVAAPVEAPFAPQPAAPAPQMAAPAYRDELAKDHSAYAKPVSAPQPRQYEEVPDVETVEVPERVVALADDLDIPELSFEEDQPAAPAYDDLDAEFAGLLSEMNATEIATAPAPSRGYDDESYSAGFKTGYDRRELRAETTVAPAAASYAAAASELDADDLPGSRPVSQADDFATDDLDYDPELDEAMTVPGLAEREAAKPRSRGMMVAAFVGAVVIAGGLGALAFSFGGKGGSEAPVIVKADNSPIKVKPENPGGAVVPNQDSKVYDAVAKGGAAKPAEPVQQKLVTNTEEPIDVASKEPPQSRIVNLSPDDTDAAPGADAAAPGPDAVAPGPDATAPSSAQGTAQPAAPAPKSEDRIAQVLQEADKGTGNDVVAVAPRKVKTMMVKPDGSLVPHEDPAPAAPKVAATEPADPAPQHVAPAGQGDAQATGTVTPATDQTAGQGDQTEVVKPATPNTAPKTEAKAQSANTPAKVPVAPPRPSDQPVDIVGEVKPDQVASIDPASAAGGGSWSMQIASQPTVESAQSTYQDLQRRYGSVLSGRKANIVKAEIAGKGTFYRVRVPAQSRNDAINLCTSYKAAGGTCFVSR
ncbi:MAG: SPOR domain-containing protein [Mesorhizobium sp.]|uniref:SPOR domain-containing protein n=1 Tax=Mesorhizobium sp. TaxID=1871066 RepID=UPI0012025920|nr:SPOR domain-containing protein [Mesorhizobium sp.]TIO50705.1 MAG: SPOR domain-containing protein [Mesorhizobium sp.]TIO58707.1 MAG: SPOR domain-containing protein [Mesorhizobium sp.]TJV63637.1 MAG: SPOR domain-containing protein [Mesorhizobium sp.]